MTISPIKLSEAIKSLEWFRSAEVFTVLHKESGTSGMGCGCEKEIDLALSILQALKNGELVSKDEKYLSQEEVEKVIDETLCKKCMYIGGGGGNEADGDEYFELKGTPIKMIKELAQALTQLPRIMGEEDETRRLREFVDYILQEGSWQGGDIDGGDAQDKAESLGLIELRPINEEDSIDGEKEHYFTIWTATQALGSGGK